MSDTIAPPAKELVDIHGPLETHHPDLDPTKPLPHERKHPPKKKAHYMNPIQEISLTSTSTKPSYPAVLPAIAAALGKQMARDVAPVWGSVPAVTTGATLTPDASPLNCQDSLDVDGAAGYHDEAKGRARGFVATPHGASILTGADADSVTISHEAIEMVLNPATNLNVDMPDGSSTWREGCDAVEGDTYPIDGVEVSNFLYPAWFDGQAPAGTKFDHLGKLTKPFTMTPSGYMGVRTEPGTVTQVFARVHPHDGGEVHHLGTIGGRDVHVLFGRDYPAHRKPAKIAKVKRLAGLP